MAESRDLLTREQRSRNMSKIRGKNTKPELLVRRLLHAKGYRYRLHGKAGTANYRVARTWCSRGVAR